MKMYIAVLCVLLVLVSGCRKVEPDTDVGSPGDLTRAGRYTGRFVDLEYGNVCYLYSGYGISCVPLKE
jgi:hypothetical protein